MKVSLYLRDDLWDRFKRNVLRRTGDIRTLSSEVQALIEDSLVEDSVRKGFQTMRIECKPLTSLQVVPVRPKVATSSEETLREMRDMRHAKIISR